MIKRKINIPDWANGQTIYEVNIRQYSKEGTFKGFEEHLPRLKDLGVGILWFMPIQPIGEKNRKVHLEVIIPSPIIQMLILSMEQWMIL
ncbi:MAG: hypothetical protein R2764_06955 [Bacteroidales bacterium]